MAVPTARFKHWLVGQLVKSVDVLAVQTKVRELVGMAAFGISGTSAFLPGANALGVTAPGGMSVSIGGLDQFVFLPDANSGSLAKVAYSTGAVAQAINAADPSSARHDLICIQFATPDVNGGPGDVLNNGVVSSTTVYDLDETFTIDYVPGVPGAGDPATPAGWVALARVTVPASAAAIDASDIAILLPTITSIIRGDFAVAQGPGIGVSSANGTYTITNDGVLQVNGQNGNVTVQPKAGSPITVDEPSAGVVEIGFTQGQVAQVPYRVTKLQGGGYAKPGSGTDFGYELSPNGGIRVSADTVDGSAFSIGFRTVITVTADQDVEFNGVGVPVFQVYLDGVLKGSCAGTFNGVGFTIPAGQHTIDVVYNSTGMGGPYYLGNQGSSNSQGGNATLFGWLPLVNGQITNNVTAMVPG